MTEKDMEIPARRVPVTKNADVVVVGGGTSGFVAAVAAARTGQSVLLVERFGYLGGCTTAPYNTSIGLFTDSNDEQIIRGIGWEFVERMKQEGVGFRIHSHSPQIWPPMTKKVVLDMVEEAGVKILFHTWVMDVVMEGERIAGLLVLNKGGMSIITGKTFVDASGDADVAAFAGAPFDMADLDHIQQVSSDYIACGADAARIRQWAIQNRDKLQSTSGLDSHHNDDGRAQDMLTFVIPTEETHKRSHIGVMPTVKLCIYREAVRLQGNADIDPLDPDSLTLAETKGLRGALDHLEYLKNNVPGFENAFIVAQTHLGVRETRRIVGDYTLRVEDLRGQTRFDDVIALNCRALDFHLPGTRFEIEWLTGHHDIPLRALIPQKIVNLLVAGRSISGDHVSQASLRGAATCMATGQAAGTAAGLACRYGGIVRQTPVEDIQAALLENGAILGTGGRKQRFQGIPQGQ